MTSYPPGQRRLELGPHAQAELVVPEGPPRPRPLLVAQLVGLGLGLALGWVGGILVEAGGTLDAAKACTSSRHLAAESHELYELLADPAGVELEAASF